jgi:type II secretory pathway pseudopilin PulG
MAKGFTPLEIVNSHGQKHMYAKKHEQRESLTGFTLIEVLAAMFIVVMGVVGIFGLVTRTVSSTSLVNSQLVASYLAQEGLEMVRNIRDANFRRVHKGVAQATWTDGLTGCTTGCEADYNDSALVSFQDRFLKLDNGFYTYDAGTDTIFTRKIIITPKRGVPSSCVPLIPPDASDDILCVSVDVSWQDRGNTRIVRGATELYNWLTPTP